MTSKPNFVHNGDQFRPMPGDMKSVCDVIPAATYRVMVDQKGVYLQATSDFSSLPKYYGNVQERANRVINTFQDRQKGTGVLLSGQKGSGKTLLAREICIKARELGMPTIIVSTAFSSGDGRIDALQQEFFSMLGLISQPCVILFDEFEKTYSDKQAQQGILTLLDGIISTPMLYLLTCNDKWAIDENMRNRPGRLYYMIDFEGLDNDFVTTYVYDKIDDEQLAQSVITTSKLFSSLSFDMLQAIVEEVIRYNEPADQVLNMMNTKPQHDDSDVKYSYVVTTEKGVVLSKGDVTGNPLSSRRRPIDIGFYTDEKKVGGEAVLRSIGLGDDEYVSFKIEPDKHLVAINRNGEEMIFQNNKYIVTFTREQYGYSKFHFDKVF